MKEKYAGLQVNTIEASETPDYLEKIITIDKEFDVNNIQIDSKKYEDYRVWLLFGKDGNTLRCLQVGATINNIVDDEIVPNIKKMYSMKYIEGTRMKHSQFYYNVYAIIDTQKGRKMLNAENTYNVNASYIKMKYDMDKFEPEYEKLVFYALDIDKYLNIMTESIDNDDIKRMICISKMIMQKRKLPLNYKLFIGERTIVGLIIRHLRYFYWRKMKSISRKRTEHLIIPRNKDNLSLIFRFCSLKNKRNYKVDLE